jgi:glycosyltransferase involved in cell wall biosynthesis
MNLYEPNANVIPSQDYCHQQLNRKPFFSVVIPTYNRASLLPQTLDSVLSQSFQDFEIIVIDNGSSDDTRKLFEERYAVPCISYIKYDINKERSWARNQGLRNSQGTFATLLDSDDFMYPSALSDAYAYCLEHPNIKFFHNKYELVNEARQVVYRYSFPSIKNQYLAIASGNFLSCIGVFMHRDAYRKISFNTDPRMIAAEDYEAWIRLLAEFKLGRINKINSGIRHHGGRSVNNNIYVNLAYQRNAIINMIKNNPFIYSKYRPYLGRFASSFFFMESIVSAQNHNKRAAWQSLLKAIESDPSVLLTFRPYQTAYNVIKS